MARVRRVFISHSAHRDDEPATQKFLERLLLRLRATPDLEPLVDQKDLQAGDAWSQRLYAWMGLCDAAVVLLSPRAVTRANSTWVPREVNLLLWRKALDPGFVVVPVLIGGLKAADLADNPFLADVRLNELQLAVGLTDKRKIDAVVQALLDKLASCRERRVFDPVLSNVEDCLDRDAPKNSIQAALDQHFAAEAWRPYVQPHQNLAVQMLRRATDDTVDRVIADVAAGSQGERRVGSRLFDALFPLRLPAEPACRMLMLCMQQEGRGAVLVNANDDWALRMLLRAAAGLPDHDLTRWCWITPKDAWGDDDLFEATAHIAELLGQNLGPGLVEPPASITDPQQRLAFQLDGLAEDLRDSRQFHRAPAFVCASYTPRWAELAASLAPRFPATVFLFWTGDALPPPLLGEHCEPLAPTWQPGQDRQWRRQYHLKLKLLGGAAA